MNKVLPLEELESHVSSLHNKKRKIVLVGGCFDILHRGHIAFLNAAKKEGDVLIVLLESDATIRRRKGDGRPVHTQHIRAKILAAIPSVDYVVLLPELSSDHDYDTVVLAIKPAIIATTEGDPGRIHKERQADRCNAEVKDVIAHLPNYASSILAKKIGQQ